MPFSFLHPWFWLGALALAAPIWLHLRRRPPRNLKLFSALCFLEDQPHPKQSPRRLRDLLLFAVRALALLLIVGAFAWPYLHTADTAPITESRVYILDNTFSRQANSGFDDDRRRVLRELARTGPEVQIAVVELTGSPRVLVSFSDDRETARNRLLNLKPSYQRGSYLAAFAQANSLFATSLGRTKRLVFLSDSQENQWSEHSQAPPFIKGVAVDLPKVGQLAEPNVWVTEPRVQRVFLGEKSLVNLSVRLSHLGPAKAASLVLIANGQLIASNRIDLSTQPQTSLLQFQWDAPADTWLRGTVAVQGAPDVLPADDEAFFTLPPLTEGKVAVLAHSAYLRVALSPEIMRGQWDARLLDPATLGADLAVNDDSEVLVLESGYLQSSEIRKLARRYLAEGRGVLLLVERLTPTVTGALRELGIEVQSVVQAEADRSEKLSFFAANHAVFHPFTSPEFGDLTEISLRQYARLRIPDSLPLLFSERGSPLLFQANQFKGKLFIAAFALDRTHTSWPVHPTFIPFLDLVLQAARPADPTQLEYEPAQAATVTLPFSLQQGERPGELLLRDDQNELLARTTAVDGRRFELRMPARPGIYSLVTTGPDAPVRVFSVNLPAKESELTYVADPEPARLWRIPAEPDRARRVVSATPRVSLAGALQQRLWWWMLCVALALLALEMLLANWRRERV